MHVLEIPEANIKRYIPEDLSQCDTEQYINMCALLYQYQSNQLSLDTFLVHGLFYLLDIENTNTDDDQALSNITQLSQYLLSFFDEIKKEESVDLQIKLYHINNPIASFIQVKKYYGTSDGFENMSFGEYVDALDPFEDFHQTGDVQYLYQLLAIFYRPKKSNYFQLKNIFSFDGDKREKYNAHQVAALTNKFKKQPIGIAYGFYLLFASFQKYITTVKIYIQGKEIDFSILFDDTLTKKWKESSVPGIGMRSMMFSMAESGIFGELKQVREAPFWEIYLRMYDIRKRDLDMQANEPSK